MLGLLRAGGCIALAWAVLPWVAPRRMEFALWVAVFYFTMLVGLSLWLARALRKDACRVAAGEIQRPPSERSPRLGGLLERAL
jgi:hypothetical protein